MLLLSRMNSYPNNMDAKTIHLNNAKRRIIECLLARQPYQPDGMKGLSIKEIVAETKLSDYIVRKALHDMPQLKCERPKMRWNQGWIYSLDKYKRK